MPLSPDPLPRVLSGHSDGHDHGNHHGPRRGHHGRLVGHRRRHRRALVADGYRVALLARRADRIQALSDALGDGGGDLVNISSVAGRTARPGNASYAATKWGLNGWSESLRQELQPDVRVIVIEPGAVSTELVTHITDDQTKAATEQFYDATSISADDIAQIIAFAVSRPRDVSINEILVRPTAQAG